MNIAAIKASQDNKTQVSMADLEYAKDRIMMGAERKSAVVSRARCHRLAWLTAIVSVHEEASDPIHKATIIPRGRALGMVMRLPERDNYSYHRDKMHANLAVSMGGRVAEEIIFGYDKVSSGASGDIQYATKLARDMVTQWGMSDLMGPLQYEEEQGEVFLGRSAGSQNKSVSSDTAKAIDREVRKIIDDCYTRAKEILETNRDKLELMKDALMEYETIDVEQINDIMSGKKPRPPADWTDRNDSDSGASAVKDEDGKDSKQDGKDSVDTSGKIGGPASEH